jgi:hypothetical protein
LADFVGLGKKSKPAVLTEGCGTRRVKNTAADRGFATFADGGSTVASKLDASKSIAISQMSKDMPRRGRLAVKMRPYTTCRPPSSIPDLVV